MPTSLWQSRDVADFDVPLAPKRDYEQVRRILLVDAKVEARAVQVGWELSEHDCASPRRALGSSRSRDEVECWLVERQTSAVQL